MNAMPQPHPEDDSSYPAPARMARVTVDDLGMTLEADLRIPGVLPEVRDMFAATPFDQHAALIERALIIGTTNLVSTVEISANDASRLKLMQVAEAVIEYQPRHSAVRFRLLRPSAGRVRSAIVRGQRSGLARLGDAQAARSQRGRGPLAGPGWLLSRMATLSHGA